VHGLHEYKGKFNPQTAKALLNIMGLELGDRVLDPFCGSGTTLVECAQLGLEAVGCDINPMAVYIANAKLLALRTPAVSLYRDFDNICERLARGDSPRTSDDARAAYLRAWFTPDTWATIELLREAISAAVPHRESVFLAIASNILRDYSEQEPADLRIRRRISPYPPKAILLRFKEDAAKLVSNVKSAQTVLRSIGGRCIARRCDSRELLNEGIVGPFDAAITSPPYATALPYIDTQRLSLVWLGLVEPNKLALLQAALVGSREFHGTQGKTWEQRLIANTDAVPATLHCLCCDLRDAVGNKDGFRRRAVPVLLYRYLVGMKQAMHSVARTLRRGARFALVVGHNHTTLGGQRFEIDTPALIESLSAVTGYGHCERIALQAYQRYGLHQKNSVSREELLILRKP
jgi:site-specific DNA-methyltransferase (cytosine-N4-specific)